MSDTATTTLSPEELTREAANSLAILDRQIAQMREQRKGLGKGIADALERRKPLARIVAAAAPRTPRKSKSANGDS